MCDRTTITVRAGLPARYANSNRQGFAWAVEHLLSGFCPAGVVLQVITYSHRVPGEELHLSFLVDQSTPEPVVDIGELRVALEQLYAQEQLWLDREAAFEVLVAVDDVVCNSKTSVCLGQRRILTNPTDDELWDGVPCYSIRETLYLDEVSGQWFASLEGKDARPLPGKREFRLMTEEKAQAWLSKRLGAAWKAVLPGEEQHGEDKQDDDQQV